MDARATARPAHQSPAHRVHGHRLFRATVASTANAALEVDAEPKRSDELQPKFRGTRQEQWDLLGLKAVQKVSEPLPDRRFRRVFGSGRAHPTQGFAGRAQAFQARGQLIADGYDGRLAKSEESVMFAFVQRHEQRVNRL
jgi:hypothetical protein